ncbi:MAG: hypothetical protein V1854_03570 [Methanobacteriota archaeon]
MTKTGKRAYVSDEVFSRMDKYARAAGIRRQEDAYDAVIKGALDENGVPRTMLALSEPQRKTIDSIAKEMDQSPEKTAQDLINFSMLVYGTQVTIQELVIFAAPVFMNGLIESHPEIAKEILQGLKQTKKEPGKLNPQAALRYE